MPQLDIFTFPSQLFWFYFVFLLTFVIMLKKILPSILAIIRVRAYIQKLHTIIDRTPYVNASLKQFVASIESFNISLQKDEKNESIKQSFVKHRQKVHLNTFFDAKFAWTALLIPSDELILLFAFVIFVVAMRILYILQGKDLIETRINEIRGIFLTQISLRIQSLRKIVDYLKTLRGINNEATSNVYSHVWYIYQYNLRVNVFDTKQLFSKIKAIKPLPISDVMKLFNK